jgi:hypothetical protein
MFHTLFDYTVRLIHAHYYTNYWSVYMYGSQVNIKFDEFKESLVSNKRWQESLQEPDVDVIPHVATRCHYNAEPTALLFHLTVPKS